MPKAVFTIQQTTHTLLDNVLKLAKKTKNMHNILVSRAGQVRNLVRKSANPQLRTNEKSCGHADLRTLEV